MKRQISCLTVILIHVFFPVKSDVIKGKTPLFSKAATNCARTSAQITLEINNVRAMLSMSDKWWTVTSPTRPVYEIPKNDNPYLPKKNSLFAGALWLGGVDAATDQILMAGHTYRQAHYSYWPGPIKNSNLSIQAQECEDWNRFFKVNKDEIEDFVVAYQQGLIQSINDVPVEILKWPGKNNPHLSNEIADMSYNLAPFSEQYSGIQDGIYDPLQGDIPVILGDEDIWCIYNDIGGAKEFGSVSSGHLPAGYQIKETAYGFATNDQLNDMTFYHYEVSNKGPYLINDFYLGHWVDPDIGNPDDDFIECDIIRNMGICYNADDFDEGISGYGSLPPAIGIDVFNAPKAFYSISADGIDNDGDGLIDEGEHGYEIFEGDGIDNDHDGIVDEFNEELGMSKFVYYNNNNSPINGSPSSIEHFYNYLQGIWKDGSTMTYDFRFGTDQNFPQTDYMFPNNSLIQLNALQGNPPLSAPFDTPWNEEIALNAGDDRRFVMSFGPMKLQPGEVFETTISVPWAQSALGDNRSSVDKLKCVDDYVQQIYDSGFQLVNGPDAPDLQIIERDRELLINLFPSDFAVNNNGNLTSTNTESYFEYDQLTGGYFAFEGYKVYQLLNQNVITDDLNDPNLARLISQSDIQNGVTDINDSEFQFNSFGCSSVPVLKVQGSDSGLNKSIVFRNDLFDNGNRIINNKSYYFMAVAYGYNAKADSLNSVPLINKYYKTYVQSRRNSTVKSAVPFRNPNGSTTINSNAISMVVKSGSGNGGNFLNFATGIEDDILAGNSPHLVYDNNSSPLDIKVYNPNAAPTDSIEVSLTSRLEFSKTGNNYNFLPGDTIICTETFNNSDSLILVQAVDQEPGIAVVLEERLDLETPTTKTLEVRLLNGVEGGKFIKTYYKIKRAPDFVFDKLVKYPCQFQVKGIPISNSTCIDFKENDFWTISNNGAKIKCQNPISFGIEELLPSLGLKVSIDHSFAAGYNSIDIDNINNGFINATVKYNNPNDKRLKIIDSDSFQWFNEVSLIGYDYVPMDYYGTLRNVLQGSFLPIVASSGSEPFKKGWAYWFGQAEQISTINNVDIVLTNDSLKWTRCPVIQVQSPNTSIVNPIVSKSQKSRQMSVNKGGLPDGSKSLFPNGTNSLSKGYGWFPGYAIDINSGKRLNMAFTENLALDSTAGNDLIYNPQEDDSIPHHYIVVTNLEYDMEEPNSEFQHLLDSVFEDQTITRSVNYMDLYSKIFTWTGILQYDQTLGTNTLGLPEMRVKLRVNAPYKMTENGIDPTWAFKINGGAIQNRTADNILDGVKLVPNPYLFASPYEGGGSSRMVKITELPNECVINIYDMNGVLIRSFDRNYPSDYFGSEGAIQNWDLRNENGLEISSGAYLIHVSTKNKETVRKFFYVRGDLSNR
ncbi:hypothetical protein HZR84_02580 [Hyphobacterium sp. CCMP332]|nr:hypothetical protein HZR84_02580 [Hyphobacterium sp. CCMP332]